MQLAPVKKYFSAEALVNLLRERDQIQSDVVRLIEQLRDLWVD